MTLLFRRRKAALEAAIARHPAGRARPKPLSACDVIDIRTRKRAATVVNTAGGMKKHPLGQWTS